MAFQIDVSNVTIPIDIKGKNGTVTIEIDKTDEGFEHFRKSNERYMNRWENMKEFKDQDEALKELKAYAKEYFDAVYGDGTYEKLNKAVGSTVEITMLPMKIFPFILESFGKDFENVQKRVDKYQKKPNQKKKK